MLAFFFLHENEFFVLSDLIIQWTYISQVRINNFVKYIMISLGMRRKTFRFNTANLKWKEKTTFFQSKCRLLNVKESTVDCPLIHLLSSNVLLMVLFIWKFGDEYHSITDPHKKKIIYVQFQLSTQPMPAE